MLNTNHWNYAENGTKQHRIGNRMEVVYAPTKLQEVK